MAISYGAYSTAMTTKIMSFVLLQEYAGKHGYQIAYSNPSFEYWYLLHFEKRNGYLKDCDATINVLKSRGYLKNYEKSADVFDELLPSQAKAIERAKERVERLSAEQTNVISHDSNPVTTVYELVEYLNSQRKQCI